MKFFCLAVLLLTCANASDSSNNNSSNTSKKVNPVGIDFSNLTSLDAVQEYAIGNIKAFLGSMENSPEYNNSRPQPMFIPNHHIQSIRKVCKPFEVEPFVRDATMAYADSTDNETNANSKAASGYIKTQAVKEIVKALQSVNLLEFPFWRLLKFVEAISFISFLVNHKDKDEAIALQSTMEALEKHRTELAIQTSTFDFSKIVQNYGSYFQTLGLLLRNTDVNPENVMAKELSSAVKLLASIVTEHAKYSYGGERIMEQAEDIVDMEKETANVFSAWMKANTKPESSE